ncbi:MAG: EamA family transporter [Bacillota bacterium]|nr:EamA family transporter [Bacillota bacterium]
MSKQILPYTELSVATAMAGSSIVAGKLLANTFPVFLSQGVSLIAALAVLFPASFRSRRKISSISKKDYLFMFLQALAGMFLFRVFMLYGLKKTTAVESGIITSFTPAALALLSFIFLKEKINCIKLTGISMSVMGVLIINVMEAGKSASSGDYSLYGNIMIFLAVICEALLTIFRKGNSKDITPIVCTYYVTLFSFILFLPVSLSEGLKFDFSSVSPEQWLYIVYYGVVVTAIAYILWFCGVSKVSAGTAAVYTSFMPISAVILSCTVLREAFTAFHAAGVSLSIAGMLLITFKRDNKKAFMKNQPE